MLPHLGAAYNLARWLLENELDAEDAVQEACLRAFKFFHTFRGGNSRAWLLTIVRNTCYTLREQHQAERHAASFNEEIHGMADSASDPEATLLKNLTAEAVRN